MIKNWSKKLTYLLIGVILSILIIYGISYLSIIKPLQAEKSAINQQVSMYEKQLDSVSNQTTESLDDDLIEVAEKVPKQPYPDEVIRDIRQISSSTNVVIDYLASSESSGPGDGEEEESSSILEKSYTLDATATNVEDLNDFMNQLITQERLMTIDTISLQQAENDVFLTISFTTFYTG
ncbi:hypothetical protein [Oceanobacillus halophilus]|uniref:Pilus assembly protein PilO n=1 Tax=Oceanobacillus halophilus TaxID=930130 RepID=A0A494ZVI7_9BACI|nr:hypothetical protein [Oceanobacillus halophilus]RKQ29892.1 hypothetical protein D8M06_16885 [Oceanobacillus halophilus]